jgi:hypothetical protein
MAEKGRFDPYNIGVGLIGFFAICASTVDKAIGWISDGFLPVSIAVVTATVRNLHDGNYKTYMIWSIAVTAIIISFLFK